MSTAVSDMETAFTDAAGRSADFVGSYSGDIGGQNLVPGVYKWGSGLLITKDVILTGSAMDVWIFQIAQNLIMSSGARVLLAGGALAKNVFWQVSGYADLGTTAHIEGVVLSLNKITLENGASVKGKLLSQKAVTLIGNAVSDSDIIVQNNGNSISGMKFNDLNGNGIKDAGEPGLQGWIIKLEQPLGTPIWAATTAVDGSYSFTDLSPGTYYVSEVAQSGWIQTFPTSPNYYTVTITEGNITLIILKDFGNYQNKYSISGMKFNDINGNGVKDAGEPGLRNWKIELRDATGALITNTVTGSNGSYSFTQLPPGTYYVSEVAQSGWIQTFPTSPNYYTVTIDNTNVTGKNFGNFLPSPPPPPPPPPPTPTPPTPVPQFTFIKEGPSEVYWGETVTYTIHFTNIGGDTTNVIVKDYLPAQAEFVDASPVYDYNKDSGTVTWKFDKFNNGGEENLWLKVTLKGVCGTYEINKATLEAENLGEILESEVTTKVLCIAGIPVYHQNFFSGYPDKTFKPERSISRAEVASSVGRALGLPYLDVSSPTFPDVLSTFWASGNIEEVYKEKLVIGYPNGTYGPDRYLTRAEAAMVFFRLLGLQPVYSSKPTFSDINSSYWAYGAIEAIAKAGIIVGYPDGTFRPDQHTTRAEYVTIACRSLFRRGPFKGIAMNNPYPDVKSTYWAYDYIMEASIPHVIVNPERLDVLIVIPGKKIPIYYEGPGSIITVPELGSTILAIVPVDGLTPTGADPAPRDVTVKIIVKGGLP
jgi:uncharacterized repeat protein (TIGR01451 family)